MNLLTSSVSNSDQNNRISALLSPFSFPQSLEQTLASLLQKAQQTLLFCVLLSPSSMQSQLVAILQEECFTLSLYLNPSSVPPRYDSIDTHIQPASALTDFRAVSFDSEGSVAFRSASSVSLATNNHASLFLFPALLSRSCTLTLSSSSAMGSIGLFSLSRGDAKSIEGIAKFSLATNTPTRLHTHTDQIVYPLSLFLMGSIEDCDGHNTVVSLADRSREDACLCLLLQPACSVTVDCSCADMTEIGLFPGIATTLHFQCGEMVSPEVHVKEKEDVVVECVARWWHLRECEELLVISSGVKRVSVSVDQSRLVIRENERALCESLPVAIREGEWLRLRFARTNHRCEMILAQSHSYTASFTCAFASFRLQIGNAACFDLLSLQSSLPSLTLHLPSTSRPLIISSHHPSSSFSSPFSCRHSTIITSHALPVTHSSLLATLHRLSADKAPPANALELFHRRMQLSSLFFPFPLESTPCRSPTTRAFPHRLPATPKTRTILLLCSSSCSTFPRTRAFSPFSTSSSLSTPPPNPAPCCCACC